MTRENEHFPLDEEDRATLLREAPQCTFLEPSSRLPAHARIGLAGLQVLASPLPRSAAPIIPHS
jgi:hypothetical protein